MTKMIDQQTGLINSPISGQLLWIRKFPLPWEQINAQIRMFIRNPFDLPNSLNLFIVVSVFMILVRLRRKIDPVFWVYSALFFFIIYYFPFRGNYLFSVSRHAMILFPIFMLLGKTKFGNVVDSIYIILSVTLYVVFFTNYTFGFFVA